MLCLFLIVQSIVMSRKNKKTFKIIGKIAAHGKG
jgi:hypothetical protein